MNKAPDAIIVARSFEVASTPFLVQLYTTFSLGKVVSIKQSNTAGYFSSTVFRRDGKAVFPKTQIFKMRNDLVKARHGVSFSNVPLFYNKVSVGYVLVIEAKGIM